MVLCFTLCTVYVSTEFPDYNGNCQMKYEHKYPQLMFMKYWCRSVIYIDYILSLKMMRIKFT